MTLFDDHSQCDYFGSEYASFLRAIGWLERNAPFATGMVNPGVYAKLRQLGQQPWQPMVAAGIHECSLCQYEPVAQSHGNIFIPGNGFLYVCPELITHYMNCHQYAPPQDFCEAVLACPDMKSVAYHKAILANGGRALVKKHE